MQILVTAEMFGYGPIITGNYLVESLKKKINAYWVFMGSGIAMEQAKRSNIFDEYVTCETHVLEDLEKNREYFESSDAIISSENLQGAIFCVRNSFKVYYIDNLFWLWNKIPEELNRVACYFMVDCFNAKENIKRIGRGIQRYELVGPLRKNNMRDSEKKENKVIINIGGADSFLSSFELVYKFYRIVLSGIIQKSKGANITDIIVCGGKAMIDELKECFPDEKTVRFESFSKDEYLHEISKARYVFLSPGLGNFFECLNFSVPVMMLPPINYSQYWQMEEYKKIDLGISMLNWCDFQNYTIVERDVEEKVGVDQVLANVQNFINDKNAWELLNMEFKKYFTIDTIDCSTRKEYQNKYRVNGIDKIAEVISKEMVIC